MTKFSNIKNKNRFINGFTLVEMITATAIFSIVMVMAMGSLLNILNANKRSQGIQTTVSNLSSVMDMISREIKTGYNYHCGLSGDLSLTNDCSSGGSAIAFESYNGDSNLSSDQFVFKEDSGILYKSTDGGFNFLALTASSIILEDFYFVVYGSSSLDNIQPKVLVVASGYVGEKIKDRTRFNLQTTISQRVIDY